VCNIHPSSALNLSSRSAISLPAQMLTFLTVFLVMVTYHGRLVEVTSRLDFLWKQQAERELNDMIESRHNNMQLLKNILPDHVAHHFLTTDRAPEVRPNLIYLTGKYAVLLLISPRQCRNSTRNRGTRSAWCLPVCQTSQNFIQKTWTREWSAFVSLMRSSVQRLLLKIAVYDINNKMYRE